MYQFTVKSLLHLIEITCCVFILLFAGCQPTSSTSGSNQRMASNPPKKETKDDDANPDTVDDDKNKNPKKQVKKNGENNAVSGTPNPDISQTGTSNKLPPSKLNWDGVRMIGTDQLFLIPIE